MKTTNMTFTEAYQALEANKIVSNPLLGEGVDLVRFMDYAEIRWRITPDRYEYRDYRPTPHEVFSTDWYIVKEGE